MRNLPTEDITRAVRDLCIRAATELPQEVLDALDRAIAEEESPLAVEVLQQLKANAALARQTGLPLCSDTGMAVIFAELGQDCHVVGGDFNQAIHEGVRRGYREGFLRPSIVEGPLRRVNTGDNTPAVIHLQLVPGDRLKLTVITKGFGCENMSALRMLTPADGVAGIRRVVVETVEQAGGNPCPPLVVGVGVGGTFDHCAYLAKRAVFRPLGSAHPDPRTAALERELLQAINALGIGPQAMGGRTTALAVHIETHPGHIASLPVAVNLQCHSHRYQEAVL
ncbi:MAG: fumarate hydratase [candidate division NC10 bacterium]|nr:fumarate hydratase [candidate division NC10 bacterium]MBI4414420.1 fumarate hydratase [candidate division NC10 bacterium]